MVLFHFTIMISITTENQNLTFSWSFGNDASLISKQERAANKCPSQDWKWPARFDCWEPVKNGDSISLTDPKTIPHDLVRFRGRGKCEGLSVAETPRVRARRWSRIEQKPKRTLDERLIAVQVKKEPLPNFWTIAEDTVGCCQNHLIELETERGSADWLIFSWILSQSLDQS